MAYIKLCTFFQSNHTHSSSSHPSYYAHNLHFMGMTGGLTWSPLESYHVEHGYGEGSS